MESASGWLGSTSRDPEGPSSQPRGLDRQLGRLNDHAEGPAAGTRDLGDGLRTKTVVTGGAK